MFNQFLISVLFGCYGHTYKDLLVKELWTDAECFRVSISSTELSVLHQLVVDTEFRKRVQFSSGKFEDRRELGGSFGVEISSIGAIGPVVRVGGRGTGSSKYVRANVLPQD